jgi:hypothetical protein
MTTPDVTTNGAAWLILFHQIPPKPDYLRVKIGRRLQRVGAIAVKNSVYILPARPTTLEDFQWIRAEILDGGGDASICRATLVDGLTDSQVEHLFRSARDEDYVEIADAARNLWRTLQRADRDEAGSLPARARDDLANLRKRLTAVVAIDFFGSAGKAMAEEATRAVAGIVDPPAPSTQAKSSDAISRADYRGRTWVTRAGVYVDRMASAWLIRRFIDRDARFRFVPESGYRHRGGELRYDMVGAEFTHEGDRCTFETLLDRFQIVDDGLHAIAEVVHDIDLKDEKFGRPDAQGIEQVFASIVAANGDDEARLARGAQVLDDLYALYRSATRNAAQ